MFLLRSGEKNNVFTKEGNRFYKCHIFHLRELKVLYI